MAMEPKSVKLGGKVLDEITSVRFGVTVPVDAIGKHQGNTRAMVIVLTRNTADNPELVGFKHATNSDGRFEGTSLEIVLQDQTNAEKMTLSCTNAFVSKYRLSNPEGDNNPAWEHIELIAGDVKLSAGGNNANFKLADFAPRS